MLSLEEKEPKSYSLQLGLIKGRSKGSTSKHYPQLTERRLGKLEVPSLIPNLRRAD